jgi:ornithine carbamoyltransferase
MATEPSYPKDLLNLKTWSSEQLEDLIRRGVEIKAHPDRYKDTLQGKTLALLFQKTSTRTRASFEVGMTQMGGHAMYMDWGSTNFALSDLADEARVLSGYADGIVARMLRHQDLRLLAEGSEGPVINGCCDMYHPCQALGDLLTIQEQRGGLKGAKLVYTGIHNNVCNSLIAGCTKVGIEITVVAPEKNGPSQDPDLEAQARGTGLYKTTLNLLEAVREADFIYTDTWLDMEYFLNPSYEQEKQRRIRVLSDYQIDETLLSHTRAKVMHCLPAHKGYEITEGVLKSPQSIVFQQAENRLHAQKALLWKLLGA